jgi:SAM-dependent methyltransferase
MPLYDTIGRGYSSLRRPDPRLAAAIHAALGDAASVINIGAGAGSYEPADRDVLAVEPSDVMIRQRPPGAAPCRRGSADALPIDDASADAAMAVLSAHHWPHLERGFLEMRRVARRRTLLLTWVPDSPPFWLTRDYFPEIRAHDLTIFPTTAQLTALLERTVGPTHVSTVPIPHDCIDGMLCAHWRRPDSYLSPDVRAAMSSFSRIDAEPGLATLRDDLTSGRWRERNAHLLPLDSLDLGYRLVRSEIAPHA